MKVQKPNSQGVPFAQAIGGGFWGAEGLHLKAGVDFARFGCFKLLGQNAICSFVALQALTSQIIEASRPVEPKREHVDAAVIP